MKRTVRTTYQCEICGHKSESELEIKKCEERGFSPRFSIGQAVEFRSGGIGIWLPAKIEYTPKPDAETHMPRYEFDHTIGMYRVNFPELISDESVLKLGLNRKLKFVGDGSICSYSIPESNIRLSTGITIEDAIKLGEELRAMEK